MYDLHPIQLIWKRLNQLDKKLESLKKENEQLKKIIDSIKPIHIDRIEYKINELTIETLSGTLNIGLTAQTDDESIGGVVEQIIEKQRENILGTSNSSDSSQTPTKETEEIIEKNG